MKRQQTLFELLKFKRKQDEGRTELQTETVETSKYELNLYSYQSNVYPV